MLLIRRFEEKSAEAYVAGKIGGFCHLYIGQEAVGVGAISAIRKDDYVLASYREHGLALAKGMTSRSIMAELFGKATGCSKGKGGSMHMFDKSVGFLGGHAIVGGQIPLATGTAFATKYKGTDQVTLCFFGEAAVNQGAFHESLNMAQLWKIPCIYICENNRYGMGTSLERAMSLSDIAQKGCAYEMAAEFVDGMDVLAVRDTVAEHIRMARSERQPTLVEAFTYRYRGHSAADPEVYRTKEEVEEWRKKDPVKVFRDRLLAEEVISEEYLTELRERLERQVMDAVEFGDNSPEPPLESLYDHIYVVGDQVPGWYAVDERTPEPHRGEEEREVGATGEARKLAEAGAAYAGQGSPRPRRRTADPAREDDDDHARDREAYEAVEEDDAD